MNFIVSGIRGAPVATNEAGPVLRALPFLLVVLAAIVLYKNRLMITLTE